MHILHKNIIEWKQEKNNVYNVSEGRQKKDDPFTTIKSQPSSSRGTIHA